MPINHDLGVIFVHIPKTAGTSLEFALNMHGDITDVGLEKYLYQEKNLHNLFGKGLQHLSIRQIQNSISKEIFSRYLKFSIVRNPYDRLVSFVAWQGDKWHNKQLLSKEGFQLFIERSQRKFWRSKSILPVPQSQFLYFRGRMMMDFVLRFESLEKDAERLSELLQTEILLEYRMNSNHLDYRSYYDEKSIKWVRKVYRKDFEYFSYDVNKI